MLRMLAPILLLAACDARLAEPDAQLRNSDLDAPSCDIGAFEVAAPVDGLHYDKSLDVLVDEGELWTELTVTIGDDRGDRYAPTAESTAPYTLDAGSWWNRDTYHFELVADTRYTLTVSHCSTTQTVAFFTSSDPS